MMILLEGVFDWLNGISGDLKGTATAVGGAIAIVYFVFNIVRGKFTMAAIVGAFIAVAVVLAVLAGGADFLSGIFGETLSG